MTDDDANERPGRGPGQGSAQGPAQVPPEVTGEAPDRHAPAGGKPAATGPGPTGDQAIDEVLEEFDRVTGEPLDTHIEVGDRVHRTLQGRLSDIGDE